MSVRFRPHQSSSKPCPPATSERERYGADVLILDDDSTLLTLLEETLSSAGLRCVVAKSPTAALRIWGEHPTIKVIVSDVFMPHMSGLEFVNMLRSTSQHPASPQVLFLTGHPSMQTAIDALRLGVSDFLTKPVRPKEILEAVQRALGRASVSQRPNFSPPANELSLLADQAHALAERLRQMASSTKSTGSLLQPSPETTFQDASLLDILSVFRELQSRISDCKLDDIGWDLLHELTRAKYQDQTLSVSDLMVLQAYVSSTTILRRINRLEELGYVQKLRDPSDGRRDFVLLTPSGTQLVERFLVQAKRHLEDAMLVS